MQSRRQFIGAAFGLAAHRVISLPPGTNAGSAAATDGTLFEGYVLPPQPGAQEAIITQLNDGRYWQLFGVNKQMVGKFSSDHGRNWGETKALRTVDGQGIALCRNNGHHSLLRLPSGNLGLIYGGPATRPGRDGTVLFRSSADEGETWSAPVAVEPSFALCRSGSVRVLRSGRIVAPTIKWISPLAGPESEAGLDVGIGLVYGWINYSDDEGKTWRKSLSEMLISLDQSRSYRGVECAGALQANFDEPVLEELEDGRLLMVARTELGRPYQSISKDGGVSWSPPRPVDLASSDSPHTLMRIPATGDLLLVWNQASIEEILTGLMRHRLSTAISKDGGVTWAHFRNLESMDDRSQIESPPPEPQIYVPRNRAYHQPEDSKRYPHSPGCLRISYATVTFWKDEVAFTYDYGYGPGDMKDRSATKIKIVLLDWLYGRA